MSRFALLPLEIQSHIYSFDPTFHVPFRQCLNKIKKMVRIYYEFSPCLLYKKFTIENGSIHGRLESFHMNGKPFIKANYKCGKKIGYYLEYFDNGRIAMDIYYDDEGVKMGAFSYYFSTGLLWIKGYFFMNHLDGDYKEWHNNGQLYVSCHYNMGILEGRYTTFDMEGKLISILQYRNPMILF